MAAQSRGQHRWCFRTPRGAWGVGTHVALPGRFALRCGMRQVLENIEAGQVQAEMARRGIRPRQRVRVIFETIESDDIPIAQMAQDGGAFDWLKDEPDLYTVADIKKPNV